MIKQCFSKRVLNVGGFFNVKKDGFGHGQHYLRPLKGQFSTAFMALRLENWKLFFGEERFVKLQVYYTLNT
jgi:hypothetical protein